LQIVVLAEVGLQAVVLRVAEVGCHDDTED